MAVASPVSVDQLQNHYIPLYVPRLVHRFEKTAQALRHTTLPPERLEGRQAIWSRLGGAIATKKGPTGEIVMQKLGADTQSLTLERWYAGFTIQDIDLTALGYEPTAAHVESGSSALVRKQDELIVTAINSASTVVAHANRQLTANRILEEYEETAADRNWPMDGTTFALVGTKEWSHMMKIPEFTQAEFRGTALPWAPSPGQEVRTFAGAHFIRDPQAPGTATVGRVLFWNQRAIGSAQHGNIGNLRVLTDFVPREDAHDLILTIDEQAVLLEDDGVIILETDRTVPLPA